MRCPFPTAELEQAAAFPENWFTVWGNLIDLAALQSESGPDPWRFERHRTGRDSARASTSAHKAS
jgi:hypothetical protein